MVQTRSMHVLGTRPAAGAAQARRPGCGGRPQAESGSRCPAASAASVAWVPLGTAHAAVAPSRFARIYRRHFGIEDFHSHFRWQAVREWVDTDSELTLEVGCNIGVISIEVARLIRGTLVASEFDETLLSVARDAVDANHVDNIELSQADLRELGELPRFRQALLIDVLEHIDDDELALRQLAAALVPGGTVIVSVPTPRYPVVFGRAFHEQIGHVRDGYWLPELARKLDAAGFTVAQHRYYTGPRASWACSRFYRGHIPTRALLPALPLMRSFAMRGEHLATADNGASLALIAVKRTQPDRTVVDDAAAVPAEAGTAEQSEPGGPGDEA